jgi:hypothetical protein
MTLFCAHRACRCERVWAKVQVGAWRLWPKLGAKRFEWATAAMWELAFTPAIECPMCGTRRDPKTLHLLPPREDYYDL